MLFMSDMYKHLRLSDVREKLPFLWENGKCGYFIQNDPNLLGEESSKDYNDDQGLRFFQIGVDGEKIHDQSNKIIISIARDYTLLFPLFLFLFALGVSIFFSKLMLKTKIGRFLIG